MREILLVFLGGGAGSVLRYLLQTIIHQKNLINSFPFGTFAVNVIGSLLIGLGIGYLENQSTNHWLKFIFIIGFCGGFTTFSTFSHEIIMLMKTGNYFHFVLYTIGSFITCIIATAIGIKISQLFS